MSHPHHDDWWSVALRGGVALLAGVVMVVSPMPHQSHLLPVCGAYMLTDGIVELVTAVRAVRAHQPWSKAAAQGILGVLFGLVNLVGGGLPAVVRADFIALRTFVRAVSDISVARRWRTEGPALLPAWPLLLGGIGSASPSTHGDTPVTQTHGTKGLWRPSHRHGA